MTTQRKAVALISGGLDSMLAAKAMLEQGIHVEGINFFTGFCVEGHTHAIRKKDKQKQKRNNALWVAEQLGIKLHIIDVVEEYKPVLLNPKYGYGAHLNPCLDCKVFMVQKAHEWLKKHNFDFIITGEVIGQRPMSQRKNTMPIVSKSSGANDLLVRPLCGKNLPATLPEREGWINREKLFGFNGRSRKPQFALANQYNIKDFAQPAGGCCFLTDKNYSAKLKDLWQAQNNREYELDDIMLLKVGRHFRISPSVKLIIGREEGENNYLRGYCKQFISCSAKSIEGPLSLIDGNPSAEELHLCAQITARYSKAQTEDMVEMLIKQPTGTSHVLTIRPLNKDEMLPEWKIEPSTSASPL